MRVEYREEPCKVALNRVKGMGFTWSLNPYMGCVHQCTFCYVRAFELRADRPYDDRYGRSIRVKTNVVEVLRAQLARASWQREPVAIGAATDPYQPAEGRYSLTRGCVEALGEASSPFSIITRGPLIVRDVDVLAEAALRAKVSVTFSVPTLDDEVWRKTEPGTAHPRQRLRALKTLVDAGVRASVGMAPLLPGISDRPELIEQVVRERRLERAVERQPLERVVGCADDVEEAPHPAGAKTGVGRADLPVVARGEVRLVGVRVADRRKHRHLPLGVQGRDRRERRMPAEPIVLAEPLSRARRQRERRAQLRVRRVAGRVEHRKGVRAAGQEDRHEHTAVAAAHGGRDPLLERPRRE
ncbi:MAG: radical SAM protein [Actinomycetota bacterium]|nr:radical SAM protein [Actinomycetota bacterium]